MTTAMRIAIRTVVSQLEKTGHVTVGAHLRQARRARNLSLADVAQGAAGVLGEEVEDRAVSGVKVDLELGHTKILCSHVALCIFLVQICRPRHSLLRPSGSIRLN